MWQLRSGLAALSPGLLGSANPYAGIDAILSGNSGAYWDPANSAHCWQDAAGTVAAGNGDPCRRLDDLSGNAHHFIATSDAARPVRTQGGGGEWYLAFDGSDDNMVTDSYHITKTTEGEWFAGAAIYSTGVSGIQQFFDADSVAIRVAQLMRLNDSTLESIAFTAGGFPVTDGAGTISATTFYRLSAEAAYNGGAETVQTYIDNAAQGGASSIGDLIDTSQIISLGASAFGAVNKWAGRFYRGFHVNKALSAGDKTTVDTFLNGNHP